MKLVVLALALAIAGCATPYQPDGARGGYSDMQLSDNTFQVEFRGNGFTGQSTVEKYWLRRCAELTQAKGFRYFEIVTDQGDTKTLEFQQNAQCTGNTIGSQTQVTCSGGGTKKVNKHRHTGRIRVHQERPAGVEAFDAQTVLGNFAH